MIYQDWRDASADEVAALLDAERHRWVHSLNWDTAAANGIVEQGRAGGVVPGWIARNEAGKVEGWTFYILYDGVLQIGGLTASRPAVARGLIDAVLQSTEAGIARRLQCFVYPESSSIASAFERQRFALHQTCYLTRTLEGEANESSPAARQTLPDGIRAWRDDDLAPTVRLLASAYRGVPGATCFAPDGGLEQWAQYAGQLTRVPACGTFDSNLSYVATTARATELLGVVMVTRISEQSAHIAQLAVAPGARRSGVARQLLAAAFDSVKRAGLTSITLMVDANNGPAASLYKEIGFHERARFLYGSRAARTRVAA